MISARRVITLDSCRESEQVAAAVAAAVVYTWVFALCLFLIVADVQITFIAVHNPQSKPRPFLLVIFFLNIKVVQILHCNFKNLSYFFSFVNSIN